MTIKELYKWAVENECENVEIFIHPSNSWGFEITEDNLTEEINYAFGHIINDKVVISE